MTMQQAIGDISDTTAELKAENDRKRRYEDMTLDELVDEARECCEPQREPYFIGEGK